MNFEEEISKIKEALNNAEEVLVAINKTPTFDSVASSLSLYLGLKKLGKKPSVFCEDKIRVEFSNLIGVDKVNDDLGGKNFVISLDYKEGSIDKVSYNIEGDKFNLVITSKPGAPALSAENVHYSYSGLAADLIFTIDLPALSDLGKVYEKKKEFFSQEKIINIDRHQENGNFGKINLVVSQAASTAEIVALLLKRLGIKFDQDLATNLLAGIASGSNNFASSKTNATSFEMAALCLRAGGKRVIPSPTKLEKESTILSERKEEKREEKAPPDWLKPKIYKGSTLL